MKVPERLETKRLVIRPYNEEDINDFVNLLKIEKDNANFKLRPDLVMLNDPNSLFSSILNATKIPAQIIALIISEKDSRNFLGTCGLMASNENTEVECFYALLPHYRGNGFAIEAMLKLFEYAFITLEIPKIVAYIHPNSFHSWKVAERIGMKYLGHIQVQNFKSKAMFFSIERNEYETQRGY
jgi:ribosomal-protein-alanine N-acetyltransferase